MRYRADRTERARRRLAERRARWAHENLDAKGRVIKCQVPSCEFVVMGLEGERLCGRQKIKNPMCAQRWRSRVNRALSYGDWVRLFPRWQ